MYQEWFGMSCRCREFSLTPMIFRHLALLSFRTPVLWLVVGENFAVPFINYSVSFTCASPKLIALFSNKCENIVGS